MRRVTFVDQFYYPDSSAISQLLSELTVGLHERGWCVSVVTSRDEYVSAERPSPVDPEKLGIKVHRTPKLGAGSIRRGKLLRQLWFYLAATVLLLFTRAPNLYVVQTTPPLVPVCVALVSRLRRIPYVVIAQDIYPEIVAAHDMVNPKSLFYRVLKSVLDKAYRGAEKVVSLGPYMSRRIYEKGVPPERVEEISNWGIGDLRPWSGTNSLRREWGLEESFVVHYSGNIGLGHEFDTFLEGALLAKKDCPELAIVFVGSGRRKDEVIKWVQDHGAEDWIQFRPYQSQDRLRESLSVADLSLVTMRTGWSGLLVPSKILGILAVGSPTLYIGPESDISDIVERFSAGVHVRNGDAEGVRKAILRAARDEDWRRSARENARKGYCRALSRDTMLDRYDEVLGCLLE